MQKLKVEISLRKIWIKVKIQNPSWIRKVNPFWSLKRSIIK